MTSTGRLEAKKKKIAFVLYIRLLLREQRQPLENMVLHKNKKCEDLVLHSIQFSYVLSSEVRGGLMGVGGIPGDFPRVIKRSSRANFLQPSDLSLPTYLNSWDTLVFSFTEVHTGNKTPNCPSLPSPHHPNNVDSVKPKCSLQISTLVGGGGGWWGVGERKIFSRVFAILR